MESTFRLLPRLLIMENFNALVTSTAQAICFGRNPDEIVAGLANQDLSSEEIYLIYMAATVFAKETV